MTLSKQFTPVEITFTRTESFKKNEVTLPPTYETGTPIKGYHEEKKEIVPPPKVFQLPTSYESSSPIEGFYEEKKGFHSARENGSDQVAKPENGVTPLLKGDDQDISYDKDFTL